MFRLIITGFICIIFLGACGLETVPYLPPPIRQDSQDPKIIKFRTPNCTTEELKLFRGIEIYYKFYKDSDTTTLDAESNISSQINLITSGYRRLVSSTVVFPNIGVPLINIDSGDRGSVYDITLDFNETDDYPGEAVASGYETITLRRGATYYTQEEVTNSQNQDLPDNKLFPSDPGHYKRFSDMLESAPDMPGGLTDGAQLKLAFYALTYGKEGLTTVYSQPVYLLSVNMSFTKR